MPKFVIEREIPGAGNLSDAELKEISRKSVEVLRGMGPEIQWLQSYVTGDKVYCVYLAPDEASIREHAKRGGFPANRISAVRRLIDPTTAEKNSGESSGRSRFQHSNPDVTARNQFSFAFETEPGRSRSSTAFSMGITQPSSQAFLPVAMGKARRANSRLRSSLTCSDGTSGAPMLCLSAAAAPAKRNERSDSDCAAAEQAIDSRSRAMPRLCSNFRKIDRLSR